jgi:hypothetical protein
MHLFVFAVYDFPMHPAVFFFLLLCLTLCVCVVFPLGNRFIIFPPLFFFSPLLNTPQLIVGLTCTQRKVRVDKELYGRHPTLQDMIRKRDRHMCDLFTGQRMTVPELASWFQLSTTQVYRVFRKHKYTRFCFLLICTFDDLGICADGVGCVCVSVCVCVCMCVYVCMYVCELLCMWEMMVI